MSDSDFKGKIMSQLKAHAVNYSKLLNYVFEISSDEFMNRNKYRLRLHERNFLHLTGVKTALSAYDFFEACINGTLKMEDFECENTKELKSKVKDKMIALSSIESFFKKNSVLAQESFSRGKVSCSLATSNCDITLCFDGISDGFLWPKSLQRKNRLSKSKDIVMASMKKTKIK